MRRRSLAKALNVLQCDVGRLSNFGPRGLFSDLTSPGYPHESAPIPGSKFKFLSVGFIHSFRHKLGVQILEHAQSSSRCVDWSSWMVRTQTLKVKDHERHLKKVEELVLQKLSRQLPEDDTVFETVKGTEEDIRSHGHYSTSLQLGSIGPYHYQSLPQSSLYQIPSGNQTW